MSKGCAERCHVNRLIDTRWNGIAKGVGTQPILGRIHMVQLQIENDHLTSSFTVLGQQPMDMLLGLDMLKRHQVSHVALVARQLCSLFPSRSIYIYLSLSF